MNRRRLEVEAWRDAMLAVAGRARRDDRRAVGQPRRARATAAGPLYAPVSRHDLACLLRLFDFPDPNITSGGRVETTVPLQQLFVLNSEFMVAQARAVAARLHRPTPAEPTTTPASAGPSCCSTAAPPTDREIDAGPGVPRAAEPTATAAARTDAEPLGAVRPGAAGDERVHVRRLTRSAIGTCRIRPRR